MHFGLFAINNGVCADPDACLPVAQLCESKGFESVWTGEHVVIPDPQVAPRRCRRPRRCSTLRWRWRTSPATRPR